MGTRLVPLVQPWFLNSSRASVAFRSAIWKAILSETTVSPMTRSDGELLLAMQRGDRSALGDLYQRHLPGVLVVVRSVLGDAPQVAEIAQDVFLEVWRRAQQYDATKGSVRGWLSLIARSRALDQARRKSHRYKVALEEEPAGNSHAPAADAIRLPEALAVLSSKEREVILLSYLEELTSSEMAQRLGIPIGTVKSRIRSGLDKLSTYFKGREK